MIKYVKNIVALLILMSLSMSSIGMNVFVHHCNSMNSTDISYFSELPDNCSACNFNITQTTCNVSSLKHNHNVQDESCCTNHTDFIKLIYHTVYDYNVKINFNSFEFIGLLDADNLINIPISFVKFIKHYSGISPPYVSNYIYFISSILE